MESSIPDYKKYLKLIQRRIKLFTVLSLLVMTAVFVISFLLPKKYESSSTVFIENNVISEMVKGISVTPSMEDTIKVLTYAITSRSLLTKVVSSMGMDLGKSESEVEALIKNLQAKTQVKLKDKHLFTISFTDGNRYVSRDFVNTLVRVYIEQNISAKRGEFYDATKFLGEQIDTFNSRLEKAEREVNDYKRDKGGIISMDEGKIFQEISLAQQKLYDLELRRRQLEGMRQITKKTNDPLLSKLNALQKKLDDLLVQYTESFPEVIQVKGDIETVKEQLKGRKGGVYQPLDPQEVARIDSEINAIKISEEGLQRYILSNKTLLQNIPAAKAGLEKLELQKQNQKNIYDQLFTRQGQSEVSKQMEAQDKSTTFRVVDPAILPVKPTSPNRLRIMILGVLGGVVASFGALLLLDQLDGSVKDVEFLKGLNVPLLAIIPRMQHPALISRERRKSRSFFLAAGLYAFVMLCFPVMELLDLPYVDKMIDSIHSVNPVHSIGNPHDNGNKSK
jgi:polysaccharide chain length determinant protein (PEP-CTERM system associated)